MIVDLTLHGVRADGTDYTLQRLRVIARDTERYLLMVPDQVDRRPVGRGRVQVTRHRTSMAPVRIGTRCTVHDHDQQVDVPCVVVRGYGKRVSLRIAEPEPMEAPT